MKSFLRNGKKYYGILWTEKNHMTELIGMLVECPRIVWTWWQTARRCEKFLCEL